MALKHNYFGIETASTPEWTVSNGMIARVADTVGAQSIRVALGGKLEITGSSGANTFILEGIKQADCFIYRAGNTAAIVHKGIEIFRDTITSTGQSIVFGGDLNNTQTLQAVGTPTTYFLGSAVLPTETRAPAFQNATVDGVSLVMNYLDAGVNALDSTFIPLATAFTVMVDGVSVNTTAVTVDAIAKTVNLTLATAVTSGQGVKLDYTDAAGNNVNAIQDAAGNDAASLTGIPVVNTGDIIAPTLSSSTPADNAITVAAASNIVLTFSEAVQASTGNIVISNGTDTRPIAVGNSQVSIVGNTVTINPTDDLTAGTTYSVQIASGVLKDLAGNSYAGLSDSTTLDFSTLDTVNHTVAMSAVQATDYLGHSVAFDFTTAVTVTGSGSELAALASGVHALVGSTISLNANNDVVSLTQLQASDTLAYGGVSFAHDDVVTVSGVTPIALVSSLIGLDGESIALDVDVDTSTMVAMDAVNAGSVSEGHWFFNAANDHLTYWDSANSLSHTVTLTGVTNVMVTGAGLMTLVIYPLG